MQIPNDFLQIVKLNKFDHYRYLESTGSTNADGLAWLAEGAPDGAFIFADHQSSGRGRSERKWVTNPESSIAVSIILRPDENEKEKIQLFSALAGVALALTLRNLYEIPALIKWPNDVLIDNKKTAGILAEADWDDQKLNGIVIGVGINILPGAIPPPNTIQFPATCIQNHTIRQVNRFHILGSFLQKLFLLRKEISKPSFLNQWENLLAFRNETVYIKENDVTIFAGIVSGIESNGDLRLISKEGMIKKFTVGDVHLRPSG
jgi:BirA family biotin operon repressor/biotin-[acetyl-CoA-carboxylase] ligase